MKLSIAESVALVGTTATCVSVVLALADMIGDGEGGIQIDEADADEIQLLAFGVRDTLGRVDPD